MLEERDVAEENGDALGSQPTKRNNSRTEQSKSSNKNITSGQLNKQKYSTCVRSDRKGNEPELDFSMQMPGGRASS